MKVLTSRAPRILYTTPDSHAAEPLVSLIGRARHSVHMAIYALTLHVIADALIAAKERGVSVVVILDAGQAMGAAEKAQAGRLIRAGIDVVIDGKRIMHSKFFVVDGRWSINGSFNFSGAGEHERNVFWLDHSRNVAQALNAEFQATYQESKS